MLALSVSVFISIGAKSIKTDSAGNVNILLLGVDNMTGYLNDAIYVASINFKKRTVNILHIPRDTRVKSETEYIKMNALPVVGNDDDLTMSIGKYINLPINYYVQININAFKSIVDSLGGVEYEVKEDMQYHDPVQNLTIDIKKGLQVIDGNKAEGIVRYRLYDTGEYGRMKEQESFLLALMQQKYDNKIIYKIYKEFSQDFSTNISNTEIFLFGKKLKGMNYNSINFYDLPGKYEQDNGIMYYYINFEEMDNLKKEVLGYK